MITFMFTIISFLFFSCLHLLILLPLCRHFNFLWLILSLPHTTPHHTPLTLFFTYPHTPSHRTAPHHTYSWIKCWIWKFTPCPGSLRPTWCILHSVPPRSRVHPEETGSFGPNRWYEFEFFRGIHALWVTSSSIIITEGEIRLISSCINVVNFYSSH